MKSAIETYLDNSATTKPYKDVVEIMSTVMEKNYANASSLHSMGLDAQRIIKKSSEQVAAVLNVKPSCIVFTSCGTEANNLAVLGTANANRRRGNHIITSSVEHPSVINACNALEQQGFNVTYLPVDSTGVIDAEYLEHSVSPKTILVSIMHVNNELGTIQPLDKIKSVTTKHQIPLHVDAVQSFGKIRLNTENIDMITVSAHKIHGPKGAGALYLKKGMRITPVMYGGQSSSGNVSGNSHPIRPGTDNTESIAGMGKAAEITFNRMDDNFKHVCGLNNMFREKVLGGIDGYYVNHIDLNNPYIINISFVGIKSQTLLDELAGRGIYVSAGAACSSKKDSAVLRAIGLNKERSDSAIRISFSGFNTPEQIDYCAENFKDALYKLRIGRRI